MRTTTKYFLLIIGLFYSIVCQAQYNPDKICRVEDGQLIFSINLKWSAKEKKELSEQFELDSVLIANVYKGETDILVKGENWKVRKLKNNTIELYKPVQSKSQKNLKTSDVFLVMDKWINFAGNTPDDQVVFGTNDFSMSNTFIFTKDNAWFYLPDHKSAREIYIAGTFNNWSTTQTPMKSGNSGWTVDLKLKPGKYAYKFIVDGEWIPDPSNKLRERDGSGEYNSIVYCTNHLFELKGYKDAKNVVVTGNFYGWNQRGIAMRKTLDGWVLPIYFRDGTYAYKFLVDKQWITDPANKTTRKDNGGNLNSFIGIGEPFLFKLDGFKTASKVILTGSFNGWNKGELVMDKTEKGWQLPYIIATGNYEYKFIVDGERMTDPQNPFTTGSGNNVNSFMALKANHLFELNKFPDAKSVIVTGSFNGWSRDSYKMTNQGGKWILPIYLKPGKYTYKFIVDGTWILDPFNKLYEQNEYDTDNSVLWIER
jgi:hypothetical protein